MGWAAAEDSPLQFIWSDGVDMFAQAQLELSQALAKGIEIYSPPGWLVKLRFTAGRRTSWTSGGEPLQ